MPDIQENPMNGEEKVHEARINWWSQAPLLLFGLIVTPTMGSDFCCLGIAVLRYYSAELAISNKRVIARIRIYRSVCPRYPKN